MFNTIFTVVLFLVSFGILFLNEDRTVRRELSLDEAASDIVSLKYHEPFQRQYINRVVHISGPLKTFEPLSEPDYNIQVQAVKLRRRVSMYQWVEESVERIGSGPPQDVMDHDERQYFYALEWQEKLIDSSRFYLRSGHQNPPEFPLKSITYLAEHVKIGEYELNEEIKKSFTNFILITSDTRPDIPGVRMHSGFYYISDDLHEPKVGDLRLQFQLAGLEGTFYTVVGKLSANGVIEPFQSRLGHQVLILKTGELSVDDVWTQERFTLSVNSWLLRTLGVGLLFIALSKVTEVLAKYKFPGPSVNFAVLRSFRFRGVRLCFTLATAVLLMAIVWSLHKPVVGLYLLICSGLLYLLCVKSM